MSGSIASAAPGAVSLQRADLPDGAAGAFGRAGERGLQLAGLAARHGHLVAELVEQVARDALEGLEVVGVHALAPAADRVGGRRLLRERVRLHPLLAGSQRLAVDRLQVVRHLRHPLLGALVVREHHRVELELDEVADRAQRALGVEDQVLVAQLEVVVQLRARALGAADPAPPVPRHPRHRRRVLERPLDARHRDVATVTDQVDEARLGQRLLDRLHLVDVVRRLLAPARLALLLGVELVERAQDRSDLERLGGLEPASERLGVEVEVFPPPVLGEALEDALGRRLALAEHGDQVGDEVGLGRDRQLGVGVQHQPEHGRAGAADADDEGGRCETRLAHELA